MSFPTRERGLKLSKTPKWVGKVTVVPHAGTWIEIYLINIHAAFEKVVPHAGTWIEITLVFCGEQSFTVVPHAGTWIEIPDDLKTE